MTKSKFSESSIVVALIFVIHFKNGPQFSNNIFVEGVTLTVI